MGKKEQFLIVGFVGVTVTAQLFVGNIVAQLIYHVTGIATLGSMFFAMIEVYALYLSMRVLLWRLTEKGIAGWVLRRSAQPKKPTKEYPELVEYMVDSQRYR